MTQHVISLFLASTYLPCFISPSLPFSFLSLSSTLTGIPQTLSTHCTCISPPYIFVRAVLTRKTPVSFVRRGPLHPPRPSPNASPREWPPQFLPQAGVMTLSFTVDSSQNHLRNVVLKHLHLLWEQTRSDFCSLADNMTSKGKVHRHFSAFNSQRHESMLFAHQNSQKLILFPCVLLVVFI